MRANIFAVSHAVPLMPRAKFHTPVGQNITALIPTTAAARSNGDQLRGSSMLSTTMATSVTATLYRPNPRLAPAKSSVFR